MDQNVVPPSLHEALLTDVNKQAHVYVRKLMIESETAGDCVKGTVRPRTGFWRFFQRKELHLWRIKGAAHPLWVGHDGIIYRGYPHYWDKQRIPQYWMRAEIERRDEAGLQHLLNLLS